MGYVGLVGAVCLASMGNDVIGVDIDGAKIQTLEEGRLPIVEPFLDELFEKNVNNLTFSTDIIKSVKKSEICCVCVGTPSCRDGRVDLTFVKRSAEQIGEALRHKNDYCVVSYRSTIPPGTSYSLILPVIENVSGKKNGTDFGYSFNPEFLREGNAIDDFFHPAKTVVGSDDERVRDILFNLYKPISGEKIHTPVIESEIIKYVDNVWHAIKVSFANEIGYFAKMQKADGRLIMDIFCKDKKLNLSDYYLKPGFAFGGSCLPKDVKGFTAVAKEKQIDIPLISSIMNSNRFHILKAVKLIEDVVPKNEKVVIVGVSFKPYTDDIRETPSVYLAKELRERGYDILYYDPVVKAEHIKKYFGDGFIDISDSEFLSSPDEIFLNKYLVFTGSYRDVPKDAHKYNGKRVFDLNGLFYNEDEIKKESNYYGMCW